MGLSDFTDASSLGVTIAGVVLAYAAVRALVLSASLPIPRLAEIRLGVVEIGFTYVAPGLRGTGFTVLDADFRASAGYGRDWRTGIHRRWTRSTGCGSKAS